MQIESQRIEYPANGGFTPGYLVQPVQAGTYPALVTIQEWWGLTAHIQDVSERFARQGFIALAPDLYHGQVATEPDEARKLAMELDRARAVVEIQGAIRYLQSLPGVAPKQIGVIGWCMGGSLTLATAAASDQVGAAVVFYGMPGDLESADQIRAPLLGLYGEADQGIPLDRVRELQGVLQKTGVEHQIHIYPDAGHAFFNDTRPHMYHAEAAEDAWERAIIWFRTHLK